MLNAKMKLAIFQHAREVYPQECCGVVTQKGRVQKYHALTNIHREPEEHFEPDHAEYAEALEAGTLIAVVHSHTGDGATTLPSAHDECMCNEFEVPFVIVSLPEGDMRIVEPSTRPLIGRPWSLGSYDCWGLIMAWHKEQGIELPDFRKDYEWWKPEHGENLYQDFYQEAGLVATGKDPEPGDVIIMQLQADVWNHGGIYLGDNQMMHHLSGRLSTTDIYSGWYQEKTVLVCRHKDLK